MSSFAESESHKGPRKEDGDLLADALYIAQLVLIVASFADWGEQWSFWKRCQLQAQRRKPRKIELGADSFFTWVLSTTLCVGGSWLMSLGRPFGPFWVDESGALSEAYLLGVLELRFVAHISVCLAAQAVVLWILSRRWLPVHYCRIRDSLVGDLHDGNQVHPFDPTLEPCIA
jgi:hypothetical protein